MWLKPWKMSSLLLFVNIQSLLMAGRWNRLWDNSLQFNRGKSSYNAKMQVWISVYSWTICALTASVMTPPWEALKWHPYDINLLAHFVGPIEYDVTTELYKLCLYHGAPRPQACHLQEESCSHQTLQIFIISHSSGTFQWPQTSADRTSPILVNNHMFVVTLAGSELIFLASLSSFLWLCAATVSLRPYYSLQ